MKFLSLSSSKRFQNYRQQSNIQNVLSRSFTIATSIGMLFLGLVLMIGFYRTTVNRTHQHNEQTFSQVELNAAYYLTQINQVSDVLFTQLSQLDELTLGSGRNILDIAFALRHEAFVSMSFFDESGRLLASSPYDQLTLSGNPSRLTWFTSALAQPHQTYYSTAQMTSLFLPDQPVWTVSVSRCIELKDGTRGVIYMELDYGQVAKLCIAPNVPDAAYLYLVDDHGTLIYHPDMKNILVGISANDQQVLSTYEEGDYTFFDWINSHEISVRNIQNTQWKIIMITPLNELATDLVTLFFSLSFILIFSIGLMIYVNHSLSALITQPIRTLDLAVQSLDPNHKPTTAFPVNGSLEIQRLGQSIQSMVSTLQVLMNDTIRQEELKRRTDLEVLHSQINPHFLYNTLDSIVRMIEMERNHDAATMLTSLARLFRISLSQGRNIIPIRAEFDHAKHYLTIQKIRYQDKFTTTIDWDDSLENCYITKLVIQPILENAIYYGMAYADGDGEILVKGTRYQDHIVISISDNGPGMAPETVACLLDPSLPIQSSAGSGIGLKNVHQRLALTFGPEYGLSIDSEPDEGTTVHIHLPLVDQEMADTLDFH